MPRSVQQHRRWGSIVRPLAVEAVAHAGRADAARRFQKHRRDGAAGWLAPLVQVVVSASALPVLSEHHLLQTLLQGIRSTSPVDQLVPVRLMAVRPAAGLTGLLNQALEGAQAQPSPLRSACGGSVRVL